MSNALHQKTKILSNFIVEKAWKQFRRIQTMMSSNVGLKTAN